MIEAYTNETVENFANDVVKFSMQIAKVWLYITINWVFQSNCKGKNCGPTLVGQLRPDCLARCVCLFICNIKN